MITQTEVGLPPTPIQDDDNLHHIVCCNTDTAICGSDVTGAEWAELDGSADECQVCIHLWDTAPTCDAPFCPTDLRK